MKVTAIIVAAGRGSRMGADRNKVFLTLCGKTILENTAEVFEWCGIIDDIVVVTNDTDECSRLLARFEKVSGIVRGGATRQQSVRNGLNAADGDIAVIHDGARALVRESEIVRAVEAAKAYGAAAVGVKCKDTLKQSDSGGFICGTIDREFVYNIQTPQVFDFKKIKELHNSTKEDGFTDDCALAESGGMRIKIVDGSYDNIKITTPEDLPIAEKILRERKNENRTGI